MFEVRITELEARKRLLVAESEINRRLFMLELARLRPVAEQAQEAVNYGRKISPLLAIGAGVLGGVLVVKGKSLKGLTAMAVAGWQLFKIIKPLLEKARSHLAGSDNLDQRDGEPARAPDISERLNL